MLVLLALLGGGTFYLRQPVADRSNPASPADERAPAPTDAVTAQAPPKQAASPHAPTFDIVRVTPEGNAVIAGRAQPGAEVTVHEGGRALGDATADRNGDFVLIPTDKLLPGGRELTLTAREPDGTELRGPDSVVVMVPQAKSAATEPSATHGPAVAMLIPRGDAAPRLLQPPPAASGKNGLALERVDYDEKGAIRFSGSAKPSATVRVYVDNKAVGTANAGKDGEWTLTPAGTMTAGVHRLRVDQLSGNGRVSSRVELPFQRTATLAGAAPGGMPGQLIVQPGQNLWRIARQTYGKGARYTVIYLANREQIRDPNLIYPGQVFAMPGE